MNGIVLKSTGKWYTVLRSNGDIIKCRIRGKIRLQGLRTTNPVAVGDIVSLIKEDAIAEDFVIQDILPRKNYIVRKSTNLSKQMQILAANIDRAYLLVTLKSPVTQLAFIDRFLVAAESFRIPTTLLFNKIDIYNSEELQEIDDLIDRYAKIGYPSIKISAEKGINIDQLKLEIKDQQVMISGHSGVGKSTLCNSLDADLKLDTGDLSTAHDQGQHTTTFAEMHQLKSGGYIIDTPGIRAFGIVDLERENIPHYFPEMRELLGACKFHNCLHLNEPKCAVKEAVAQGWIEASRYHTYLQLMTEDPNEIYRRSIYE